MFWAFLYWIVGTGDPWYHDPAQVVDVTSQTVQALIARAEANEERERGGMVAWTYARDRVVERRELRLESEIERAARVARARRDRANAALEQMRMVI